jgi:2-oxoglutarate dehydrogenase E2 component (dihydrolipoamide succinyltransferase)
MSAEFLLPVLPLGIEESRVARWLKQPGDSLAPGDALLIVESDRAEIAIPAASAGLLEQILVAAGASVRVGMPIALIAQRMPAQAQPDSVLPRRLSPVAHRIAAAREIDITNIRGSGPGGRLMKADVLAAIEYRGDSVAHVPAQALAADTPKSPDPAHDLTPGGQPIAPSTMRRAIAEHMVRSRATSPHALTAMDVDMGQVAAVRARLRADYARRGAELTYTACIALAAVAALAGHPLLNSSWSDLGIVLRRRVHLGVAVALPDGLITPVIREAQDLNLRGLARAVADLARRARAGALRPGEASGATFTITNPGAGALWFGTPIIPQPQSAILGFGVVRPRPLVVADGDTEQVVVRPAALLTLAYDARVLDQCHADAFLRDLKWRLERFTHSQP